MTEFQIILSDAVAESRRTVIRINIPGPENNSTSLLVSKSREFSAGAQGLLPTQSWLVDSCPFER
jgi:hypothetical protein